MRPLWLPPPSSPPRRGPPGAPPPLPPHRGPAPAPHAASLRAGLQAPRLQLPHRPLDALVAHEPQDGGVLDRRIVLLGAVDLLDAARVLGGPALVAHGRASCRFPRARFLQG